MRSSSPCSSRRSRSAASISSRTLHLDARPRLLEAAEQAGEDAGADALEDPDAERAGGAFGERRHVGLRRVELRDDRVGVAQQEPAGVGQVDRPWAAGPLDEPLAHAPLELGDLLADRRLGVAELAGGAAERPRAADGLQGREMPQFDAEPSITFHYRIEL